MKGTKISNWYNDHSNEFSLIINVRKRTTLLVTTHYFLNTPMDSHLARKPLTFTSVLTNAHRNQTLTMFSSP